MNCDHDRDRDRDRDCDCGRDRDRDRDRDRALGTTDLDCLATAEFPYVCIQDSQFVLQFSWFTHHEFMFKSSHFASNTQIYTQWIYVQASQLSFEYSDLHTMNSYLN